MASKNSEFILDEGLDDDEDVLAFHSQRTQAQSAPKPTPSVEEPSRPQNETPSPPPHEPEGPPPTAIIIDGLPLTSRRADLDAFLGNPDHIINVRLRRLEKHGLLRVRVEYDGPESTADALKKDGCEYQTRFLSVKPATEERWLAASGEGTQSNDKHNSQPAAGIGTGFWSAFEAARHMAENLERRARILGDGLEQRLHVSERVAETRQSIVKMDEQYGVSKQMGEMARVGKEKAQDVDRQLGISEGVGKVTEGVGNAAKIVVREVDENFRVGDRVREVTNSALKDERLGGVARTVVSSADTPTKGKKNYQPRGDPPQDGADGAGGGGDVGEVADEQES